MLQAEEVQLPQVPQVKVTEVGVAAVEVPQVMIVVPCLGPLCLQLTADPYSEL